MSEEMFYRCIPELNKECKKENCYINGGECEKTIYKKYTLKGLLEEIERLTELCNKYEEEHKTTFETWQKDIKENKLLHSIIKEVREYIKTTIEIIKEQPSKDFNDDLWTLNRLNGFLVILDKVEENK